MYFFCTYIHIFPIIAEIVTKYSLTLKAHKNNYEMFFFFKNKMELFAFALEVK